MDRKKLGDRVFKLMVERVRDYAIVILDKDGSILVADDWAGAIYRISYKK